MSAPSLSPFLVLEWLIVNEVKFFCALPPSIRPSWAHRHATLLSKTNSDSALICLEFPTTKPRASGGPPFGVPSSAYEMHLRYPGVEIEYDEEGNAVGPGSGQGEGGGDGGEGLRRVGHWKAERTHEMGRGKDWISVWKL